VNFPVRRTIFLALLAALLLIPAAAHAAADPIKIIRDCEDDGALQGTYTASELRSARSALPTDIDEYSDCRDVLGRAIAAKTSSSNGTNGGSQGAGTGAGGSSTSGGASGGSSTTPQPDTATTQPNSSVAVDPGIETGPVTAKDWQAVGAAEKEGGRGVAVNGRDVSPMLVAEVGRNGLPSSLIVALALLGGAVLAACLLPLRRRVTRHRA
jgi:hypothetical protein